MQRIASFFISCPTQISFGVGSSQAVFDVLSNPDAPIVFVQGASGVQSAALVQGLQQRGHDLRILRQSSEPTIDMVNDAVDALGIDNAAAVVACGGGAVIDTGKALAFLLDSGLRLPTDFADIDPVHLAARRRVRSIALPTTAGTGAEVTANAVLGVPSLAAKVSLRGKALFPDHAFIDPALMGSAPQHVKIQSGLDAITQVIESYTSSAATPFSDALTQPAISQGLTALRCIIDDNDADAWSDLAWTSLASGLALANSGLGAAHGLASILGGQYDAPHGALCGRFLVPVIRANLRVAEIGSDTAARITLSTKRIAQVFTPTSADPTSGFARWIDQKHVPRLRDFGVSETDIPGLAARSMGASSSKKNAVSLDHQDFERILKDAL